MGIVRVFDRLWLMIDYEETVVEEYSGDYDFMGDY